MNKTGEIYCERLTGATSRPVQSQRHTRAVYTRENKPRITQSAAYVSRELSHLYGHSLSKELIRGLRKPRTSFSCRLYEQFAAYISRGLCNPRLISLRINGPTVTQVWKRVLREIATWGNFGMPRHDFRSVKMASSLVDHDGRPFLSCATLRIFHNYDFPNQICPICLSGPVHMSPVKRDLALPPVEIPICPGHPGHRDLSWPGSSEHYSPVDRDENISTAHDWTVV